MKKALASLLTAALLISIPGSSCTQALAMDVVAAKPSANSPAANFAAGAPWLPGLAGFGTGLTFRADLTGLSLFAPTSPLGAASGAPLAASAALPAQAASAGGAAAAAGELAVAAVLPTAGAPVQNRLAVSFAGAFAPAASPAAADSAGKESALGAALAMGQAPSLSGPRFDGARPAGGLGAQATLSAADGVRPNKLSAAQAPAQPGSAAPPVSGVEPKGPTREFWMGWKTELRHWLFRKKLMIEPFQLHWTWFMFPQWFGDGLRPYLGKYIAPAVGNVLGSTFSGVWILYSNVISLRKNNLFGTRFATVETPPAEAPSKEHMSSDGSGVESDPNAGRVGTAMSHSVPLEVVRGNPAAIHPKAMEIADKVLNRDKFQPARGVSSHFGVHVQRVPVHGLFRHKLSEDKRIRVPLAAGRSFDGKSEMVLEATEQAPNKKPGFGDLPVYLNQMASAWHFNEMYGPDAETTHRLRSHVDGKMRMEKDGLPPLDPRYTTPDGGGIYDFGNNENMSVPLAIQHILWLHTHNWFAGALKEHFTADAPPAWVKDTKLWYEQKAELDALDDAGKDEWLFQKTRINLSMKNDEVHTNDWTPLLLPNPVTSLGLHMDWAGILGLKVKKLWYTDPKIRKSFLGAILKNDLLSGVPGSTQEEWSSEYDMGETFALVYLLRELMRDKYPIYSYKTGELLEELDLSELVGPNVRKVMERFSQEDLWYSMGIVNPGDATRNNVPNALRQIRVQKKTVEVREALRLKDEYLAAVRRFGPESSEALAAKEKLDSIVDKKDLAFTDLVRADERQWPTYVQLLKALDLPVPKNFLELTGGDAELASILEELYDGDLSRVHAHIGIRVAPRPPGFVLSLVSFMLFSQKAPERLKSNWFLSEGFTPEVTTEFGMRWQLSGEESKEILLRYLPGLAPALDGKASYFQEFNRLHPQTDPAQAVRDYEEGVVTHTMGHISGMGPVALDTLYRNTRDPGKIPEGLSNGKALIRPATRLGRLLSWLASFLWQGKVFDPASAGLKNRILGAFQIIPASVSYGESWFDGERSIIIDYGGRARWPFSRIRDEIRQVGPNTYIGYAYVRAFGRNWNVLRFALDFTPAAPNAKPDPAKASSWEDRTGELIRRADERANTLWKASALIMGLAFLSAALAFPSAWLIALVFPPAFLFAAFRNGAALDRHKTGVQGLLHAFNFVLLLKDQSQGEADRARREKFALQEMRYLNNTVEPAMARAGGRSLALASLSALAVSAFSYLAWGAIHPAGLILAALPVLMAALAFIMHRRFAEDLKLLHIQLSSSLREVRPQRDPKDLPGDSHLEKHVRYFSGGLAVIRLALATIYGKLRKLGIPAFKAVGTYLGSHLSFGRKTQKHMTPQERRRFRPDPLDIYTPRITDAWLPTHTGVYGPDGNVDKDEFNRIFDRFAGGRDYITAKEVARMRAANRLRARARGTPWLASWFSFFASKRQFDQLFMIAPDRVVLEDGKLVPAISRAQLLYWYQGGLRYDIADEHEPVAG